MSSFFLRSLLLALLLSLPAAAWATLISLSIVSDDKNLRTPITRLAIDDCISLLKQACPTCEISLNNPEAQIVLQLPELIESAQEPSRFSQDLNYPYLQYPNHDYSWYSQRLGDRILLTLQTTTAEGVSCGLYGLLQEQLWFNFYHPKETNVPNLQYWPLSEEFFWHAEARFDKKGFHLHTMHPIELTECLLNVNFPDGQQRIKEYIDWLARNQQNYFEFNVLSTIDTARWADYMRPIVDYAHQRGILIGIDISLNMRQQRAFRLTNGKGNLTQQKAEIERRLHSLCRDVKWDVINLEFSSTEFSSGNAAQRQALQLHIGKLLRDKYKIKLMGRKHVVKSDNMRAGKHQLPPLTGEDAQTDKHRGVLIHTVMFYSLFDSLAPVYENKNFEHLRTLMMQEKSQRETWYYPESAYWITFDNSIPLLLLPYLSARLQDIEKCDSLGIKGHATFSSGWEWGYWLTDWSIARWSWRHNVNGTIQEPYPCQFVGDLFKRENIVNLFSQALDLQQEYFKKRELIRFLAPASVTDELPHPLNMEFQPRPKHTTHWLRFKANAQDLTDLRLQAIEPLRQYAQKNDAIVKALEDESRFLSKPLQELLDELIRALKVNSLRARHRSYTLEYLTSKRNARLVRAKEREGDLMLYTKAQKLRLEALNIVKLQEFIYRYPTDYIARPFSSGHTAYDFGYLYTTSELQLWQREEEQIRHDRYSPFYMSVWNIPKIMGLQKR